jgi:hypothetical protein
LNQSKTRKVGRPKLPKGEAKGKIVPVRFAKDDLKAMETAARLRDKTLSEWVRIALSLEVKQEYNERLVELATRSAQEGGFVAFGWITSPIVRKPIPFEAPGRHLTRQAAIAYGLAWCKEKIDLPASQ